MQFFPAALIPVADTAASLYASEGAGLATHSQYADFDSVLSSFIEEGRSDYTGRPAEFAGLASETGTLGELKQKEIMNALRKRQVDTDIIQGLERLSLSNEDMTVGKLFGMISGNMRRGPAPEGEERDQLGMLFSKLGFDRDGVEDMLELSDAGSSAAMWKKLGARLAELQESADVTQKEFSALLKGLDLSEESAGLLRKLFGQKDDQAFTGAELEALLGPAANEFAKREQNGLMARAQIRAAVDEALKAAKLKEHNAPVEDMRGSRRSEQAEAFMQASVLKKTGVDDIKREATDEDDPSSSTGRQSGRMLREQRALAAEENAAASARRDSKDAKDFREQLARGSDSGARPAKSEEKSDSKLQQLFQRIDLAGLQYRTSDPGAQAQNLNSFARNFHQAIFSQVENGILQSMQDGGGRLTLQLNPGELGELTVLLSLRQGELNAVIRTDNQDTTSVIREQLAELKASLEAQGIKVKELDVQTRLNDNATDGKWNGHQEHNLMRDSAERDRLIRLSRMQRDSGTGTDREATPLVAEYLTESTGLHIVA